MGVDPSRDEVHGWGYQECLPHQAAVVDAAAALAGLTPTGAPLPPVAPAATYSTRPSLNPPFFSTCFACASPAGSLPPPPGATLSLPEAGVAASILKLLDGVPDVERKKLVLDAVAKAGAAGGGAN